MDLARNRAVDRLLDRVRFVANLLFDDISDRCDRPGLQDRLVDGPHHRDLLLVVNGLRDVLEHRLTLELILGVPATLLGHGTDSIRCTTRVARSLRRVRGHAQPDSQGKKRDRRQFSQHRTLHITLRPIFGAHRFPSRKAPPPPRDRQLSL